MSETPYAYYVGIDWASEAHRICLLDAEGRRRGERSVEHTGPGLATLVDWRLTLSGAEPAGIAVAIEVPRGAVVETLLERGFPVFAVNPKPLDRFRDRHTVAGAIEILRSLPGIGRLVAATMLGEAAQPLATRDSHTLHALTGLAPVTVQSGKRWRVAMRYAGHRRLRHAVSHRARVSVQCDAHSRAHDAALRARGHSHPRALRGVADRLLAVLIAMLKTDRLYDPTRRHGPYAAVAA